MMKFKTSSRLKLFHMSIIIAALCWTGVLVGIYLWWAAAERDHLRAAVRLKAESIASNAQVLREWIDRHGGIYVEVMEGVEPHPLLMHLPERDIFTPSAKRLTLMDSSALLSVISPYFGKQEKDRMRLVSNRPMNPANLPDSWEKAALEELASGSDKVEEFISVEAESLFRLMYSMELTPGCLMCHHYSFKPSDKLAGGLSVIVDKTPYDKLSEVVFRKTRMGYYGIWFVGLLALTAFDVVGARLIRQIEFTATHDSLTSLYGRGETERLLHLEFERAERYQGNLTVLMIDIDHFKRVNDKYGHRSGDETLKMVAQSIKGSIRKTDILGRYGGEEFIVLAPGISCDGGRVLATRLNTIIKGAQIQTADGHTISVTISIGVSCFSKEVKTPEALVENADQALYQAKEAGRDRTCVAD